MRFLLFIFMFVSSLTYGRSYNVLYPLSEDEVMSASSIASAKGEGLRALSEEAIEDIEVTETTEEEKLIDAVFNSDVKEVKKLLKKGAYPNARDADGYTLLHSAVANEVMAQVKVLFERDGNLKVKEGFDKIIKQVQILLEKDIKNPKARAELSEFRITKLLLDEGAKPNAKDSIGRTPVQLLTEYAKEIHNELGDICRGAFVK